MALADDLAELDLATHRKTAAVDDVLAALPDTDRAALLSALSDRRYSARQISALLMRHGHLTEMADPAQAVRRWRLQQRTRVAR